MGYVLKVNFGSTFVQYKCYYWTFLYTIKPSATDLSSSSCIGLLLCTFTSNNLLGEDNHLWFLPTIS